MLSETLSINQSNIIIDKGKITKEYLESRQSSFSTTINSIRRVSNPNFSAQSLNQSLNTLELSTYTGKQTSSYKFNFHNNDKGISCQDSQDVKSLKYKQVLQSSSDSNYSNYFQQNKQQSPTDQINESEFNSLYEPDENCSGCGEQNEQSLISIENSFSQIMEQQNGESQIINNDHPPLSEPHFTQQNQKLFHAYFSEGK